MSNERNADVDALMTEIRRRVADKKAAGLYSVDALFEGTPTDREPFRAEDLAELAKLASIETNLRLARSTKPGIGQAVGKAKAGLVKATSQPLIDVADKATGFNMALLGYVVQMAQELALLRDEVQRLGEGATDVAGHEG